MSTAPSREAASSAGAIASSLLTGENKDTAAEQEMTEIVIENPPEETGEIRIDLEREEAESSSEALPEETEAPSESYAGPPGSNDNIEVGAGPQQPESVTEPAPSEGLPPAPEPETEQTGPAEVPDDLHTGPGAITESTYRREADTPVYWEYCRISGEMVELKASAAENAQVYETSDPSYYLFDLPIWADGTDGREPAASAGTEDGSLFFSLPFMR